MLSPAVLYQTTSLKLFGWLPTFCFPQSEPPYSWAEWFPKPQTCEVPLTSPFISDPRSTHIPRMMRTGELSVRTQWWQQRAPAEMAQNSRLESLWLLEGRWEEAPSPPPAQEPGPDANLQQGACSPPGTVSVALLPCAPSPGIFRRILLLATVCVSFLFTCSPASWLTPPVLSASVFPLHPQHPAQVLTSSQVQQHKAQLLSSHLGPSIPELR